MNIATWVMAIFTILVAFFTSLVAYFTCRLVGATKEYTEVTKKLLEQSEKAFKQSGIAFEDEKKAFEANIISHIMSSAAQLAGDRRTENFARSFIVGMTDALNAISVTTGEEVQKGLKAWHEGKGGHVFEHIFKMSKEQVKNDSKKEDQ